MASYVGERILGGPTDGISSLRFSPSSDLLVVASWDATCRLYDVVSNTWRATFQHSGPVLDCCFQTDGSVLTGGLDSAVHMFDAATGAETMLGRHSKPVRCLTYLPEQGLAVSGSWDSTAMAWDPRAARCVATLQLPGKVYAMDCSSSSRLVIGCSDRHICIFDTRRLQSEECQRRESSLKYQTRCVACYPNGQGFAVSSVEGRVALEYFDSSPEAQALKYAFKCHRTTENGTDVVHPVNALSFHAVYGTFATGGGDGVVNVWDGSNKKRLHQISRYPCSVAGLSFNRVGNLLAVASSYTYEYGEVQHAADEIYLRSMQDVEVRPKPRK